MKQAIYVPGTRIVHSEWLAGSFFLWEKLYTVIPPGITTRPTRLENRLRNETDFIENAEFWDFISTAEASYLDVVERIFEEGHIETREVRELIDQDSDVWVFSEKVNDAIIQCWEDREILKKRGDDKYRVPRFWGDLWLISLARAMGKRDGIPPITDRKNTERVLRLCHQLDALGDDDEGEVVRDQMKGVFLKVGLPAPGLRGFDLDNVNVDEWTQVKQDLTGVREEYHAEVESFLKQVPVCLKREDSLASLVRDVRESVSGKIEQKWSKTLSAAGWNMFGAGASILFAGLVEPELLKGAVLATGGTQLVYTLGEYRTNRHKHEQLLLYEYELKEQLGI